MPLAVALWDMIGVKDRVPHYNLWIKFVNEGFSAKSISKDAWMLLIDFGKQVKIDCSNYDVDG